MIQLLLRLLGRRTPARRRCTLRRLARGNGVSQRALDTAHRLPMKYANEENDL